MTYQLIKQKDIKDFNTAVNNFLKDGWELYGETQVVKEGEVFYYYQSVVKE